MISLSSTSNTVKACKETGSEEGKVVLIPVFLIANEFIIGSIFESISTATVVALALGIETSGIVAANGIIPGGNGSIAMESG